ncbi:MAG TPA: type II toxin-antitoxin system VapC family toxin [Candidatus Nanopelagicales bacterium]|nr:type II toxin-antitoxin system VapC family toxin [Candidatus Nanopelagicales bacterium]
MSACVVDSSAWVSAVLGSDERGERVVDRLEMFDEWWAPEAFDLEVLYALRGNLIRGSMSMLDFMDQANQLIGVPIERMPTTSVNMRIASLASSVSAYDAAFVAVAELLDAPLLTTDARLARAPGPCCEFLLVEGN